MIYCLLFAIDSLWVDFDDRFRLDQGGQCVDGGDDPGYEGMPFYTTALDDRCDVPPVAIGYHYPGVVRFVDADTSAAEIDQDGLSWTTAYAYLQDALDEAGSPNISGIAVANGTYYPDEDKDEGHSETRTESFALTDGLALYGGFAGGSNGENPFDFDMSTRNFDTNETILDGDIDDNNGTLDDGNSYHVVTGADYAIVDGFAVTGGNANGSGDNQYGGGVLNIQASPNISNCIIKGNYADYGGVIRRFDAVGDRASHQ